MSVFIRGCIAAISIVASTAWAQETSTLDELIVTGTRLESTVERSPASVTVITAQELQDRQITHVADALRNVPGLDVVQTGAPGQLTSVFTRGLTSEATQVMIDGLPVNQGLAGLFNFADLSTENIDRIEVVRGPQSSLYGPRAGGGVVNIITKTGNGKPTGSLSLEAGSFGTFREAATTSGSAGTVDYFAAISHLDTDNDRPNSQYRYTSGTARIGWQPTDTFRFSTLVLYSLADTGNPGSIFNPKPLDNLLTERWLIAPKVEWDATSWWHHTLSVGVDRERQVSDPSDDGFVGPTRALFKRWQVDYQNVIEAADWLQIVSGYFYSRVELEQEQPFIAFGDKFITDNTENHAAFLQFELHPIHDLTVVASGRFDHFSQSGDIGTWRVAANYVTPKTGTILHSSVATGFSPATSQDKIYGNNFNLDPNETFGWDAGFEQPLMGKKMSVGATFFHNDASNLVGFDGDFNTFNLGSATTHGIESFLRWTPIKNLDFSINYTWLETEKTSSEDIQQPNGARLARRPRNHFSGAISYRWFERLQTRLELESVSGREELSFGAANFDIEDYTTLRVAADYEVCRYFHLTGRVENLLDEEHAEVFGYPSLGRAYYGGVRMEF
ncbi:MAG: TonB-dependent receptor [Chthoniobacterales bacterium]